MECRVTWLGNGGMAFSAETGSGHQVTMDGPPEAGGKNSAPRPMELILAGTGGCSSPPAAFPFGLALRGPGGSKGSPGLRPFYLV